MVLNRSEFKKEPPRSKLGSAFLKDVYAWIEGHHPDIGKYREPGLHASSLWKTCGRREVLIAQEKIESRPEEVTAGGIQTTDEGHILHALWQGLYLKGWGGLKGYWVCDNCGGKTDEISLCPLDCLQCSASGETFTYSEVGIRLEDLKVVGHCDGIVGFEGEDRVFELKTKSVAQFKGIHFASPDHVIQAHTYMKGLGLTSAFIVYIQKGRLANWKRPDGVWHCSGSTAKCFLVKWDDEVWDRIKVMVQHHHRALAEIKSGVVSELESYPRTCSSKKCDLAGGCPVRERCFELGPVVDV